VNTDIDVRSLADGAVGDDAALHPAPDQTITAPAADAATPRPAPPDHDARHVRHLAPFPAGAVQVHAAAAGGGPPVRAARRHDTQEGAVVGERRRNRRAAGERVGGGAGAGAREEVGEEAGEGGFEHRAAGADDARVGLDDGPDGGHHRGLGRVGGGGREFEGRHAED